MKKILLIVAIAVGAYQLKAQTVVNPLDSTLLKSPDILKSFKPADNALQKQFFNLPPLQSEKSLTGLIPAANSELFASRMPVIKLHSSDKMPIAKLGDANMKYTMLIKKEKVIDPLAKTPLTQNPYLPASPVPQNRY